MTDSILLQEYARTRSPDLLAELASRHTNWVYSAALRMVHDPHLAEEVTQAVFLVLIRKAATLEGNAIDAWLFGVTRFAAKTTLRTRARRQRHERLAATMTQIAQAVIGRWFTRAVIPPTACSSSQTAHFIKPTRLAPTLFPHAKSGTEDNSAT